MTPEFSTQSLMNDQSMTYQLGLFASQQTAFSNIHILPHHNVVPLAHSPFDQCLHRPLKAQKQFCLDAQYSSDSQLTACLSRFCEICCGKEKSVHECSKQCARSK